MSNQYRELWPLFETSTSWKEITLDIQDLNFVEGSPQEKLLSSKESTTNISPDEQSNLSGSGFHYKLSNNGILNKETRNRFIIWYV